VCTCPLFRLIRKDIPYPLVLILSLTLSLSLSFTRTHKLSVIEWHVEESAFFKDNHSFKELIFRSIPNFLSCLHPPSALVRKERVLELVSAIFTTILENKGCFVIAGSGDSRLWKLADSGVIRAFIIQALRLAASTQRGQPYADTEDSWIQGEHQSRQRELASEPSQDATRRAELIRIAENDVDLERRQVKHRVDHKPKVIKRKVVKARTPKITSRRVKLPRAADREAAQALCSLAQR
jgi:hypothetical protein